MREYLVVNAYYQKETCQENGLKMELVYLMPILEVFISVYLAMMKTAQL